jgi:hypothetical protein
MWFVVRKRSKHKTTTPALSQRYLQHLSVCAYRTKICLICLLSDSRVNGKNFIWTVTCSKAKNITDMTHWWFKVYCHDHLCYYHLHQNLNGSRANPDIRC